MTYPVMSTMCVGRGIVFPNDSVWRLQPPSAREMVELWTGNFGLSVPPPMMRTPYGMGADGSVWEYAPTQPGGIIQLFNGQNLPTITGISPTSGQAGTSVTITGTGFTGATAVQFGSTNATSFTVNSSTSITAVSPSVLGLLNITVTTAGGTSIAGASSQYTGLLTSTAWNPSDDNAMTLTNNNLTATFPISGNGAVRGVKSLSSGKYYFEGTMAPYNTSSFGVATGSAALQSGLQAGQATIQNNSGDVQINGAYGGANIGAMVSGAIIGVAVDLTARLIWFRQCPSGNWLGNVSSNPSTGSIGLNIAALTGPLYPIFGSATPGNSVTANFGGSAFSGAVPTNFVAGWG